MIWHMEKLLLFSKESEQDQLHCMSVDVPNKKKRKYFINHIYKIKINFESYLHLNVINVFVFN